MSTYTTKKNQRGSILLFLTYKSDGSFILFDFTLMDWSILLYPDLFLIDEIDGFKSLKAHMAKHGHPLLGWGEKDVFEPR